MKTLKQQLQEKSVHYYDGEKIQVHLAIQIFVEWLEQKRQEGNDERDYEWTLNGIVRHKLIGELLEEIEKE